MLTRPQPTEEPTTSQIETSLTASLVAAQSQGERFLDVVSGVLYHSVTGARPGSHGAARCCRVMRRMMGPGDVELSPTRGGTSTALLIRYALPRRLLGHPRG